MDPVEYENYVNSNLQLTHEMRGYVNQKLSTSSNNKLTQHSLTDKQLTYTVDNLLIIVHSPINRDLSSSPLIYLLSSLYMD